jgi:hypothetical protein
MQLFKQLFFRSLVAAFLILGSADAFAADGSATNTNTVSSNLTLTATAETAVSLTISTNGGVVIDGGSGAFTVAFGNVNGLGVGSVANGVSVNVTSNGATYTTPVTVTPAFSGFESTTATVKVYQDAGTDTASQDAAREGDLAATASTVPSTSGTARTVSATAASATGLTRYVGIFVSNANGGSAVTGSLAPVFIYSVTVN